ncbi:hypothetical protein OJAV_G00091250 [Oryzias javanicus]|uniref:Long-chain-fatty-acid--CoA ligase n=1 Tax=Oryzias javanicus TaxID=123683 RepID=A0A437D0T6_ORYJA|nr:hypothetical protein OJAV_G00091250 [Oryzias javanicus]
MLPPTDMSIPHSGSQSGRAAVRRTAHLHAIMGTLRDLQFALQLKIEELRQRDTLIDELELELDTKDELIRRLQEELDRYRTTASLSGPSATAAPSAQIEGMEGAKKHTVISEPFIPDPVTLARISHKSCDKSQQSRSLIQAALLKNDLLKNLDEGEMRAVTSCLRRCSINQSCSVIQEGSTGEQAFILEEGRLTLTKDGCKLLTVEPGEMIGELALLYNCIFSSLSQHSYFSTTFTLFSAFVSAQSDCKLWVIDRKCFQTALMHCSLSRLSHSAELLGSLPLLQSLPEDVIMKISELVKETNYADGEYIIHQGAVEDNLYVISKGQVTLTEMKAGHEEHTVLSELSEEPWFGENAVWREDTWTVSAMAVGAVTCLVIDRETFKDVTDGLLTDCHREVQRSTESKVKTNEDPALLTCSTLSDFQIIRTLGVGEFGHLDLVQLKSNIKLNFAMRVLKRKLILNGGQREHFLRESRILMEAQCPFIVRFYKIFRDPEQLYILTEACLGGNLSSFVKEKGCLDDCTARFYTACVVEALIFLHNQGVVYRDINPEHVALDEHGYAKLTGSRCLKRLDGGKKTWTFCGVLVFELLSGLLPFDDPDQIKIITATVQGIDHVDFPKTICKDASDLIKNLCRSNPSERLGSQRNGVKDVQQHKWFEDFSWDGLCSRTLKPPVIPEVLYSYFGAAPCSGMPLQEWMRSLRSHAGLKRSELEDLWSLLPSVPVSSISLSTSSLLGLGALASVTAYWLVTRPRPLLPPCDLRAQSVAVGGNPSCRRSALLKDDTLLEFYYDDVRTAYDLFQRGLRITGNGQCLGYRKPGQPYEWISYTEVAQQAQWIGSGLLAKGCLPNPQQYIGIFGQNKPEWVISELACYTYSMAVVPLYDTLGTEAMVHIINLAEMTLVICDQEQRAASLLHNKEKGLTPKMSCLVLFTGFSQAFAERAKKCGVEVLRLDELMELGRQNLRDPVPPQPQDLAVVCFTSGTTGKPKGAMITHGNIASNTSSVIKILEGYFVIHHDDVSISYLPLAHMFERMIQLTMFCFGASVGFYQGDITLLMDDMKTLKPTFLPVVPRLLNRIYDKILGSVKSPLGRALLHFAVQRKQAELSRGIIRNNSLWDKLMFNKIQASMGGNLRFVLTASAPISSTVLSFLRATLGCMIFEGYGQTECTSGCTFSMPGDSSTGHVGAPLPCAMVKVVDIPEMNYYAKNGEGEICIRGPSVFRGYLRDPERTAEALDSEGWLHTGDVGQWLKNGSLRIIDRKKHIFKLSQGEYIAPEKIENIYVRSAPVLQVFVHGDSLQSYLVGIVVPDPEVFIDWSKERGFMGSYEELCQNPDVKNAVLEDMKGVGKEAGLKSFEQVKDLYLHPEMFSIANGLLTPTLKSRRNDIRKVFQEQLSSMYSKTPL